MLQAANTDLFNPLVPKAHNSEGQNLSFLYTLRSQVKLIGRYLFFHPRHFWVKEDASMFLLSDFGLEWRV